uniref:Uncharacterized protein n=1 Tax=Opuntia streptacantha TaxID=393608 RepID=A0A7C9D0N9_OPUST
MASSSCQMFQSNNHLYGYIVFPSYFRKRKEYILYIMENLKNIDANQASYDEANYKPKSILFSSPSVSSCIRFGYFYPSSTCAKLKYYPTVPLQKSFPLLFLGGGVHRLKTTVNCIWCFLQTQ